MVVIDGKARGIIARNLVTGELPERHWPTPCALHRRLRQRLLPLTNAMGSNVTAAWKAYKKGAFFGNPCFTQIHPTCIPVSRRVPVEADADVGELRNDGRVWVPQAVGDKRKPEDIPDEARLLPRAPLSVVRQPRAARRRLPCGQAGLRRRPRRGRGRPCRTSTSATLDQTAAHHAISERYGNLFEMYEKITGEDPYKTPMRIYPAVHYTMGGLWVDYNLMTTVPGLYALGEANFSDHGANRLGASAPDAGLADGYFVIPTLGEYLADDIRTPAIATSHPRRKQPRRKVRDRIERPWQRERQADGGRPPQSSARSWGLLRHGAPANRA